MAAAILAAALIPGAGPVRASTFPAFEHVFVIVMENHSYGQIIGSSSAPYINSLASSNGLATNYNAVAHPSLPNYLALTGGSTFGITSDCTTCWVSASNIADSMEAAGSTWKAYEESMPSPCFVGDSYPYAQKHDPFIYFNDVRNNTARCQSHVVPYTQLASDLTATSTTPNYAFITPNLCNDMHDCSIGTGDSWLQQQVPSILSSPAFRTQRSLLAITWDEDDSASGNHVPLILIGAGIGALQSATSYNHYSLLHTLEVARGAAPVTGNDANAPVLSDFITSAPPPLPPAVITSISPQVGSASGGTSITINGSGLQSTSKVMFGSSPASSFTVVSDSQITAVSPPQTPGAVDVRVTAATTSAITTGDIFTVNPVFPGQYTPLVPYRILDTRDGTGGFRRLAPGQSVDVQVAGVPQSGVPAMTSATPPSAVVINVTAVSPSVAGFLTLYATGLTRPLASNLNFAPWQTVANLAEVALGVGGRVTVFNSSGSTDVVIDVEGWVSQPATATGSSGLFEPVPPSRLADTRTATALGPGQTLVVPVAGQAGIPVSGAQGAVLNVTATDATAASYLTVFPTGTARPLASNLNFAAGQTVPNRAVAKLGGGSVSVYNGAGSVDVVVDVGGWFTDGTVMAGARFSGLAPARLLDTRSSQPIGPGGTVALQVTGHGGVPASGVSAVVLNVTATDPSSPSFLTAWPAGGTLPPASDLNYSPGQTVANLVVVAVGPGGVVDFYNATGSTDVVVDVVGWYG